MTANDVDFDSTLYRALYTCVCLLLLKTLFMVPLRARFRNWKKGSFFPELYSILDGMKGKNEHPDGEKARNAHLNDLYNIIPFISVSYMYSALKPNSVFSIFLFVAFTIARFVHTYVNAVNVTKGSDAFASYAVGLGIIVYMAGYVVLSLKDSC